MAAESTVLPTLLPHPPQRMDAFLRSSRASVPACLATALGSELPPPIFGRPSVYFHIQVRSIQSFSSHSQSALSATSPLLATAPPRPRPMMPRNSCCGMYSTRGPPSRAARRFLESGMPAITAKTPAFGRGCPRMLAQSPAAKKFCRGWPLGSLACSVVSTSKKPEVSVSRPSSRIQDWGAPSVHQTHSPNPTRTSPPGVRHTSASPPLSCASTRRASCSG
mmetsp:Transcript_77850/g.231944  ORF Transcript_77850/g.231944 Transcript_77850/m.231944 type:complete len:221 (+) Transcript_77850:183-845(+)